MKRESIIIKELAVIDRKLAEVTNETAKEALRKKRDRLKAELKDPKQSTNVLAKKLLAEREAVKQLSKVDFNDLIRRLSKKPEYAFLKTMDKGVIRNDIERKAKPVGWRFKGRGNYDKPTMKEIAKGKKDGTVYREVRPRRSDVSFIARLEDGGPVGNKNQFSIGTKLFDPHTKETLTIVKKLSLGQVWVIQSDNNPSNKIHKNDRELNELIQQGTYVLIDSKSNKMETGGDVTGKYCVVMSGGSIGSKGVMDKKGRKLVETFETREEAAAYAKRRNAGLSPGEKTYYKMKFFIAPYNEKDFVAKMKDGGPVGNCTSTYYTFCDFVQMSNDEYIQDANIMPYIEKNGVIVRYTQGTKKVAVIVYNPRMEELPIASVVSKVITMFPANVQAKINSFASKYNINSPKLCSATLIKIVNHNGELMEEFEEFSNGGSMYAGGGGIGKKPKSILFLEEKGYYDTVADGVTGEDKQDDIYGISDWLNDLDRDEELGSNLMSHAKSAYNYIIKQKEGQKMSTGGSMYAGGGPVGENIAVFSVNDETLDMLLHDHHGTDIGYIEISGDTYYTLNRKDFERFLDAADSKGFDVDYIDSQDSVIDVMSDGSYTNKTTMYKDGANVPRLDLSKQLTFSEVDKLYEIEPNLDDPYYPKEYVTQVGDIAYYNVMVGDNKYLLAIDTEGNYDDKWHLLGSNKMNKLGNSMQQAFNATYNVKQQGSAEIVVELENGNITVYDGGKNEVLLSLPNVPKGSWDKLFDFLRNLKPSAKNSGIAKDVQDWSGEYTEQEIEAVLDAYEQAGIKFPYFFVTVAGPTPEADARMVNKMLDNLPELPTTIGLSKEDIRNISWGIVMAARNMKSAK